MVAFEAVVPDRLVGMVRVALRENPAGVLDEVGLRVRRGDPVLYEIRVPTRSCEPCDSGLSLRASAPTGGRTRPASILPGQPACLTASRNPALAFSLADQDHGKREVGLCAAGGLSLGFRLQRPVVLLCGAEGRFLGPWGIVRYSTAGCEAPEACLLSFTRS